MNRKLLPILLAIAFLTITVSTTYSYYNTSELVNEIQYFVEDGDTLWSIASEYNFNNEDVRKVIHRIQKHNGISNTIQLDQEIIIPVYN
ncbi:MAG: LysM peptidoglycan-binding domain-containing protein [Cyclobacteriaceae bacterium]